MKHRTIFSYLAMLGILICTIACQPKSSGSVADPVGKADSTDNKQNPPINWADSLPADALKNSTANKYGVKVLSGGNYFDLVFFIRNDSILAVDPLRNGNWLGVRGEGNDNYRMYWTGTGWEGCKLFPCTGMDIWTMELPDGITLASVRHGGVRDHVVCYAIYPPGVKIIYRSPIWRDFGDNELTHGVAVSRENRQYKIEGRPWSHGNDGMPTANSHWGIIHLDPQVPGFWAIRAGDSRNWVDEPAFQKKEIEFIKY